MSANPSETQNRPVFVAEIVDSINAFDLERAAGLLHRYESSSGPSAVSLYYRARVAVLTGDLNRAAAAADRCVETFVDASICHEARAEAAMVSLVVEGNVFKQLGAARKARRHLNRAVALDPDNLRARMLLVRYYSLAPWFVGGSKSKAKAQVEACAERDEFWGHAARAVLALAEHRYADAISALEKAQALRPQERDPTYYLAQAYIGAEETSAAIHVLESLVSRYPKFHDAWLELGLVAARSAVTSARGMAALEHFLKSAPKASQSKRVEAALALSRLYEAAGRPEAAITTLRFVSDEFPDERKLQRTLEALCKRHQSTMPDCAAT